MIFFISPLVFPAFAQTPRITTYQELVSALRERRDARPNEGKESDRQEIVEEAWDMGKMIHDYAALNYGDLQYRQTLTKRLVVDLQMKPEQLTQRMKFAKEYPNGPPAEPLSWSHYRMLITLDDPQQRTQVEKETIEKGWSFHELMAVVTELNLAQKERRQEIFKTGKIPEPNQSSFRIYPVVNIEGKLVLDLGLSNYFQPQGIEKFKENDRLIFENGKLKIYEGTEKPEPFYRAVVTEILDGDTFYAVLDMGWGIFAEQRLRIKWIDAPEINQPGGEEARSFLADKVMKANGRAMVRVGKPDKYNRYLVDLWMDGVYINQELVEQGVATIVTRNLG